jgi:hypothetical protein
LTGSTGRACKPCGEALSAERDTLAAERDTLQAQNERLHHLLLKLRRLQFGRKAEHLPDEQLQLGLEDLEQAIAQEEAQAEKRDPALREARTAKRRTRRGALRRICHGRGHAGATGDRLPVLPGGDDADRRSSRDRGRRPRKPEKPSGSTSSPPRSG